MTYSQQLIIALVGDTMHKDKGPVEVLHIIVVSEDLGNGKLQEQAVEKDKHCGLWQMPGGY